MNDIDIDMVLDRFQGLFVVLGAILLFFVVIFIAWAVFYFIGMWKLYKKMNKPAWAIFIPFYKTWVLVEAVGLKWYWFLIACASSIATIIGANGYFSFIATIAAILADIAILYNLSKQFHKSIAWMVVSIFFGGITLPILGYSNNDEFDASAQVTPNAMFDANNATVTEAEVKVQKTEVKVEEESKQEETIEKTEE